MITPELEEEKKSFSFVTCSICHRNANSHNKIKKIGSSFGIVCDKCLRLFSDKEIDLMYNMCTAFGGYFSKMSNSKEVTYSKLKDIAEDYKKRGKHIESVENDVKTLHSAFLYGITSQQLVKGLKLLID